MLAAMGEARGFANFWGALIVAVALLISSTGAAQPATLDEAAAQALFEEAGQLMKADRYAEACPKLEESLKLSPGAGIRFNLAQCYEQLGRLASAWSLYLEVVAETRRSGHEARAKVAQKEADKLRPRLGKLRIHVVAPIAGLVVSRDSADASGQLGTAVPVDHGTHRVEASAPGYMPWTTSVVIEGTRVTDVTVPALQPTPDAPRLPQDNGKTQRAVGLFAGGAGLAAMAVGVVLGVVANGKNDDALARCNGQGVCGADGLQLNEEALRLGNIGTAVFIVGAADVVGGAVLYLTGLEGDSGVRVAPHMGRHQASFSVEARW